MKLYRYMSAKEYELLMAGETLENRKTFTNARTDSQGFCFLPEIINFSVYDEDAEEEIDFEYTPEMALEFLSGIVTAEILVEFDVHPSLVRQSYGVYADPTWISGWDGRIEITEYCAPTYSKDTFIPRRYATIDKDYNIITWHSNLRR